QVARRDQRIQAKENEIKNLEVLLEAKTDMKKAAEAKNAELVKELENLHALFVELQVNNDLLSQQVSTLQAQVTGEEKLKAAVPMEGNPCFNGVRNEIQFSCTYSIGGSYRDLLRELPLLEIQSRRIPPLPPWSGHPKAYTSQNPAAATDSSRVPSTIERSPLDFTNENPSQQSTGGDGTEDQGQEIVAPEVSSPDNVTTTAVAPKTGLVEEISAMGPRVIKERRKRRNDGLDANAPPKEAPIEVSNPDPLSFVNLQSIPKENVAKRVTYLLRELPLLEIQSRRIPPLPPWSGHPKAYTSQSRAPNDWRYPRRIPHPCTFDLEQRLGSQLVSELMERLARLYVRFLGSLRSKVRFCEDSWLRFAPAFWLDEEHCVLVLRFGAAFWLCVLLIEDSVAFCLEDIQCAGSDTRPPMLDRTDFASWQQWIRLYCQGKENGVNILKSIGEGPYRMGTVRAILAESTEEAPQFGPERPKLYYDLASEEKDRQHKGESIHDYYVRFAKLINDMRNIKMTMTRLQLNSKFVNNMLPEWGRFVTAVKLNRRLRDSNYDQLYAYLKQHETHAMENKMMLERFSQPTVDPPALLSNVSNPQHYSPSSSASSSTQVPPPLANSSSPTEDLIKNLTKQLARLTQSYKTFLPQTNNQLRTSSSARNQATGGSAAGYEGAQNKIGNVNQGQARPVKCYNYNGAWHIIRNCTQPKRPQDSEYFKDKMLLMQAQENGVALDAEQLLFLAGGQDYVFDNDADDCDAFDSDVDEAPTVQTMFMANLSSADPVTDEAGPSYDSDILSENSLTAALAIYKEQVELFVTAVKLNRGLRESNYGQLFAYLKQHEAHAKENKMVLERLSQPTVDPLALFSNVFNTQHGSPSSLTSFITPLSPPCANSTDDLIENLTSTLALLTQSYRTFLPQTNNQLRTSSNPRNQSTVQDGRVVVQNVQGKPNRCQGMNPWGGNAAGYREAQNRVGNAQENGVALDAEQLLFLAGGPDKAFDDDVNEQPVQDLALNVDNVFQAEDCDAFDSDVDEATTTQTMFMANLSSADPITDEAGPSYDSDILSEVQDHDQYLDDTCAYQEEHVMHDSVQLDHVVDLHADYTSVGNMISYDQYVKDNEVLVVHSNASSVHNDTFMMIYNDMCEPSAPSVSNSSRNAVVKNSLTAELATYRE
nr:hypothetical protein [Tanacetum cinerariifolium]